MRKGIVLGIVAIVAMLVSPAVAGNRGVEFIPLGIPEGASGSFGTTITADGTKVAGSAGGFGAVGGCIVWEEATGWTTLDYNSGACYMSRDGLSFTADQPDEFGYARAARWDGSDFVIVEDMPTSAPCDFTVQSAYGISGDGSTIVGLGYETCSRPRGFTSTEAGGMMAYDGLTDRASRINGANWDGSVLIGWNDGAGRAGMKWVDGVAEWIHDYAADPTKFAGEAYDANTDGSAIAGIGYQQAGSRDRQGWIWTAANGLQGTGALGGGFFSAGYNFAVNEAGTMAGGAFGFGPFRDATLWTEATGLMNLNQFLINQGLTIYFEGWRIFQVNAMDDAGTRLVVFAKNPQSALFPNETAILDISKVSVCHAPPGQPELARTLNIAWESVADHMGHGDFLGICEAADGAHGRAASVFEHFGVNPNNLRFRDAVNTYSAGHSALLPPSPEAWKTMLDAGTTEREVPVRGKKMRRQGLRRSKR